MKLTYLIQAKETVILIYNTVYYQLLLDKATKH